jgi:hypothetical protein
LQRRTEFSIARLHSLGTRLLTYVRSNRSAIIDYAKRYRAGLRIAMTLAESAVNSLVGNRMVKKQQMRCSLHGAHMLMQVRTADINGELRNRLRDCHIRTCRQFSSRNRLCRVPPEMTSLSQDRRSLSGRVKPRLYPITTDMPPHSTSLLPVSETSARAWRYYSTEPS